MTNPSGAPKLFDHAALHARIARAERSGAETFLLEAVSNDLVERLSAVLRINLLLDLDMEIEAIEYGFWSRYGSWDLFTERQ